MFARTLVSALALALSVSAVPTSVGSATTVPSSVPSTVPAAAAGKPSIHEFEVYNPAVKSPAEGDVWNVGETKTVTWDASVIPKDGVNHTGLLLLGYIEDGQTNEHLDIKRPLAYDFPLEAGQVDVKVPDVQSRDDYVVVLFGDSGNTSHKFTIKNADGNAEPSASAAPSNVETSVPAPPTAPAEVPSSASTSIPTSVPATSA